VRVDPGQFEQVMLNLVANSRDAMPGGGRLLIETSNTFVDRETAERKEGLVSGPHVLVAVSDNGAGMPAETLSRVFEPFFTTKEPGKGTGLGLATAYGIVKQSGGDVTVYSEPGRGTTVRIYLPETTENRQEEARLPNGSPMGGQETLLVVEDEAAVRALAAEVLRDAGYHVLDAGNVADAMRVAAAYLGPIHLLVTDVIMPGGAGPELARKLILERPEIRVLYMSGYTEGAVAQHGDLHAGASFLPKPFTPALLLDGVRNALDRG
jgi:CheY-like chemotaxis protein